MQREKPKAPLKIESGIAIWPRNVGPKRKEASTALLKMKRGESVLLPLDSIRARAIAYKTLGKGKFATRSVSINETRIWRTA